MINEQHQKYTHQRRFAILSDMKKNAFVHEESFLRKRLIYLNAFRLENEHSSLSGVIVTRFLQNSKLLYNYGYPMRMHKSRHFKGYDTTNKQSKIGINANNANKQGSTILRAK